MSDLALSEIFFRYSNGAKGSSKFYSYLARKISEDSEILELVKQIQIKHEPPHLHFLYSIHYLMLKGVEHELRKYYPSIVNDPKQDNLISVFKSFCHQYKDAIAETMQCKKVQTHEVRRCTTLLPGFVYLNRRMNRPLYIIEIGASAGLNLFWDQYNYNYSGIQTGNIESKVKLDCEIINGKPLLKPLPEIVNRIGIDLNPLHLENEDDRIWLQSMIWPDQPQRMDLLRAAIDQNLEKTPKLIKGNAIDVLPNIMEEIPKEQIICIYQTISMYLFSKEDKEKFYSILKEFSFERDIYFLSLYLENALEGKTDLMLETFEGGKRTVQYLADCHYHGKWIAWQV